MIDRARVNAAMRPLIDRHFGCWDSVVETLRESLGRAVSAGTITKRLQGELGWPVEEVAALEDAAGAQPVTRLLARRLSPSAGGGISAVQAAGEVSREAGEAVAALLDVLGSERADDHARAAQELAEARAALDRAEAALAALRAGAGRDDGAGA
mgnify:CR=1 FL=1